MLNKILNNYRMRFIFTALHLGLHTNSAFKKLIRIIKETNKKYLIYIYNFLFFIFYIYCFWNILFY